MTRAAARRQPQPAPLEREVVRERARAALGVTGDPDPGPPLRQVLARHGGAYPLLALGTLGIVDTLQSYGFLVLGPEIARSLGVGKATLGGLVALKVLALTVAALPIAALVQRVPRRGLVSIVTAYAWSLATLLTGFATGAGQMAAILVADGASSGSVTAVHRPLLLDSYDPQGRVRVLSSYRAAEAVGSIVAPLIVGLMTALLGFTWRGVFLAMGVVCLVAAAFASRLRDPGFGRFDEQAVRDVVSEAAGGVEPSEETRLGFFEIARRLLLIPTVRRLLTGYAALGVMFVPLQTYLIFFLDQRWGLGPGGRGAFFAVLPVFTIAALALAARRGESLWRQEPGRLLRAAAVLLTVGVVAVALAIASPVFVPMVVLFGLAFAAFGLSYPALETALLSVVSPRQRPHASALAGISLAAVGGLGGLLLLGGVDRRYGIGGAVASVLIPGLVAARVLWQTAPLVGDDLDRLVDDVLDEVEIATRRASGITPPLLEVRGIHFSYGDVPVLFDVGLTVAEGEVVALLGTNGAGKSTLLRVICGLGLPARGSVRLAGADVTFLDAERRVALGIVQVPGGRATFGSLSVTDTLRVYAARSGLTGAEATRRTRSALEQFPRLAERRGQLAGSLSGGEQQMLALAKALVHRPRLLLIDELSLGLAPKVVGELLETVRAINGEGTAVVLVEQSVNVALSLAQRACFMERGEVRFSGPAADLLERPDLLRSVFLEGAAAGMAS